MAQLKRLFLAQPVLWVALLLAACSMFFVPPSRIYGTYIDFKVLSLLFCLMAVVAGCIRLGIFDSFAHWLLSKTNNQRTICAILVLLPYFASMFVTNDVALLTFVPLAVALLAASEHKILIYTIVLQTIGANIGSAVTPIGNPQNLYLYSFYNIPLSRFLKMTLPIAAVGLALLLLSILLIKKEKMEIRLPSQRAAFCPRLLSVYGILFLLCLCTVFGVLPYIVLFVVTCLSLLVFDRKCFMRVDYGLLFTFVCFFVFVGNLGQIDGIRSLLERVINGREFIGGILLSQIISNVPAALMLSGFTDNASALVLGTNVGGLGTMIASLASLISFTIYGKIEGAQKGRYFLAFTIANGFFLAVLILFALMYLDI